MVLRAANQSCPIEFHGEVNRRRILRHLCNHLLRIGGRVCNNDTRLASFVLFSVVICSNPFDHHQFIGKFVWPWPIGVVEMQKLHGDCRSAV